MQIINNMLANFSVLCDKYGKNEAIKGLKTQYSDVCSGGDVLIND
jgi:hypothetical protein